jgi:hypothetical protein
MPPGPSESPVLQLKSLACTRITAAVRADARIRRGNTIAPVLRLEGDADSGSNVTGGVRL